LLLLFCQAWLSSSASFQVNLNFLCALQKENTPISKLSYSLRLLARLLF
jgi:hypothetical protein